MHTYIHTCNEPAQDFGTTSLSLPSLYTHINTYTHTYIHTYTHVHKHIHTYIHTHM